MNTFAAAQVIRNPPEQLGLQIPSVITCHFSDFELRQGEGCVAIHVSEEAHTTMQPLQLVTVV